MTGRYDLKITSQYFRSYRDTRYKPRYFGTGVTKSNIATFQTLISILQQYWSDDYRHFHKIL